MTEGFGNRRTLGAEDTRLTAETKFGAAQVPPFVKMLGTTALALMSVGVVLGALWLLIHDKLPFMTVTLGVFLYSFVLVLIGRAFKS